MFGFPCLKMGGMRESWRSTQMMMTHGMIVLMLAEDVVKLKEFYKKGLTKSASCDIIKTVKEREENNNDKDRDDG